VHDRINIEVSRGCTMGCRFCQAGMIYRPLRERSPERVLEIAGSSLKHTGYDEISLTSLSAGDYSYLLKVIKDFNAKFGMSKTALSLPSLRVASVSREVLKEIKSVRKTGFTMAPEAATERLRSVINKDFSSDDYEKALNGLFAEGWLNLKLYFMIGLPTERDEDVEAIRDMAVKALQIAKKNTGRFVNISITVSPFVPKPHTPFQWFGRIGIDEIKRKQKYLREALGSKKFKYKGHDDNISFLEAVFARGDEKLSALIEKAWQSGCRLDGWSEMFDFNKWLQSMDKTGIDGHFYAERAFCKDDNLPWDYIDTGIKKSFLYKEYERALSEERTQDCKKVCTACGLKCKDSNELQITSNKSDNSKFKIQNSTHNSLLVTRHSSLIRVRVQFSKTGKLRYLSHLELVTVMLRGLRRANVPLNYSKGFHPSPLVSFGPSLGVGIAGEREYFDMEVFEPFDIKFYMKQLNNTLPEGIKISKMAKIMTNEQSLNSFISRYEYNIKVSGHKAEIKLEFKSSIIMQRDGKSIDISPCIEDIKILGEYSALPVRCTQTGKDKSTTVSYSLILRDHEDIKVRVGETVKALFGIGTNEVDITRTALYGRKGKDERRPEGWYEPL
jgi:radical SAM-linked protein